MPKKVIKLEKRNDIPYLPGEIEKRVNRVAAYVRVSTSHEEQHMSLLAQTDYYMKKIAANPDWVFAGIYSDDGISGTSYHRRDAFNRMIQDCRDGKVTMILTKSISRFARNTVDSINTIRELKALSVGVMFEKENIWTLDSKGEFLLTVMSSIAQEESRSISENVTWGHRKRMADGRYSVAFSRFLGYDQGANGEFILNEEEAVTVRLIFSLFLQGFASQGIADRLTALGIPSPADRKRWHTGTVNNILQNEKYRGDARLQKSYVEDFLTKKQIQNKGVLPQYYVTGGHQPIIDPNLFDYVQEEISRRFSCVHEYSGVYDLSGKIICDQCGEFYGTRIWHNVYTVWSCRERGRTGHSCRNIQIYDYALRYQLKQMLRDTAKTRRGILKTCTDLVRSHVDDVNRREAAVRFLQNLQNIDPDNLDFGEEPAFIIRSVTVHTDNHIETEFVDGKKTSLTLRRYSPAFGWKKVDECEVTGIGDAQTRACLNCGRTFNVTKSNAKKKYCSPRCRCVHCMDKNSTMVFTCQQCGKRFTAHPAARRKYCSQECYIQARFHS